VALAMERLEQECVAARRGTLFTVLRPFLKGDPEAGGYRAAAGFGVYSSTKFAVEGLSEALHAELAQVQRAARAASIGFRNPLAVRIALLASVLGFLFFGIAGQISALLSLVAMLGAGVFSVFLYRRRTGLPVSLAGGIHMGWITGVFSFITAMILVTIMAVALTDQTFASVFQSQLGARSSDEIAKQVLETFHSPKGIADILVSFFVACCVMPTVGGALASFFGRRPSDGRSV